MCLWKRRRKCFSLIFKKFDKFTRNFENKPVNITTKDDSRLRKPIFINVNNK